LYTPRFSKENRAAAKEGALPYFSGRGGFSGKRVVDAEGSRGGDGNRSEMAGVSSDSEARMAKVKKIQERMAMTKAFLQRQQKLPTKKKANDDESADPSSTNLVAIQDNHLDKGKSALAKKTSDEEAVDYAWYRLNWESNCCKNCDYFENLST
jgi:hypothetical protein